MISRTTLSLYLLTILGLSGFIAYRHYEQEAWLQYAGLLHQDMVSCRTIIEKETEVLKSSIEKKSYDYPCQKTRSVSHKAGQINALIKQTRQSFHDILIAHKTHPWDQRVFGYKNLLDSKEEQEVFRQKLDLFRDSITLLLASDSVLTKQISEVCILNEDILNSAHTDQKVLYVLGMELRLLSFVHQVLTSLETKIIVREPMSDRVMPAIGLETPCIKAGKPFFGEMFGICYSSEHDSTLRFFVNNQEMPNVDGVGKVKLPMKGLNQKLELSILLKHPFEDTFDSVIKRMYRPELCKN